MKNFIYFILISILSFVMTACSKDDAVQQKVKTEEIKKEASSKIKEPTYPIIDTRFEKVKVVTLEYLTKRQNLLKKEEQCVKLATNREKIKSCLEEANEERKMVSEEIKSKKKEVKKESVSEANPIELK